MCWLPKVDAWARVVAGLLRPGGRLFIREGHPMLWGSTRASTRRRRITPWNAVPGQMTLDNTGEWRFTTGPERVAASYTLEAVKE